MSTVQQTAAVPRAAVQSLVLDGIDWRAYTRWLRLLRGRRGVRVTYDRGTLEVMTLTFGHESWSHFLARFVVVLTEELNLPIASGGSTTWPGAPGRSPRWRWGTSPPGRAGRP